jgi:hypothetical protein
MTNVAPSLHSHRAAEAIDPSTGSNLTSVVVPAARMRPAFDESRIDTSGTAAR